MSTLILVATTGGFRRVDSASPKAALHNFAAALQLLRPSSEVEQRVSDFLCTVASEEFAAGGRHLMNAVSQHINDVFGSSNPAGE